MWQSEAHLVVLLLLLLAQLIRVGQGMAAEAVCLALDQGWPIASPRACNCFLCNLMHLNRQTHIPCHELQSTKKRVPICLNSSRVRNFYCSIKTSVQVSASDAFAGGCRAAGTSRRPNNLSSWSTLSHQGDILLCMDSKQFTLRTSMPSTRTPGMPKAGPFL